MENSDWAEPMETDALLVEFMDPTAASYRTVGLTEEDSAAAAELPLENNGRVEGRQRLRHTISDDDEMLDIAMDGRDAQGITELPDKSHGEYSYLKFTGWFAGRLLLRVLDF